MARTALDAHVNIVISADHDGGFAAMLRNTGQRKHGRIFAFRESKAMLTGEVHDESGALAGGLGVQREPADVGEVRLFALLSPLRPPGNCPRPWRWTAAPLPRCLLPDDVMSRCGKTQR